MEEKLRAFLAPYIGQGAEKRDIVTEEAVDLLAFVASEEHIEQEITDYGTAHPEAPFWDCPQLSKRPTPGGSVRLQMEIDSEDDDD